MKKLKKILIAGIIFSLLPKAVFAYKTSCGNIKGIPEKIPQLTSYIITIMQVAATVILVIIGTIDLFKGITSSKEEEMKKGQQSFIKRLITAALVFFVVLIAKLLVGAIADKNSGNIISCIDCFISNRCGEKYESEITNSLTNSNSVKKITPQKNPNDSKVYKSSPTTKSGTKEKSIKIKNNTMFIGDSEVALMCGSNYYNICKTEESLYEGGVGCDYLEKIKPEVNEMIKSKEYNIVIILGFNGAGKTESSGKSFAESCFARVSKLAQNDWKNQSIIYVSVNPCDDVNAANNGMYITNTAINSFNKTMKSKINSSKLSNMKFCDTNSKVNIKEIDSGDGGHYTKSGAQKIYNIIKNDCLK